MLNSVEVIMDNSGNIDYYKIKKVEYCYMDILLIKLLKNVTAEEKRNVTELFKMPSETIPTDSCLIILNLFKKYQKEISETQATIENVEEWIKFIKQTNWNEDFRKYFRFN